MPKDASLYETFAKGFADAIADIREKVVEEPMYGRALSERDAGPQWPQASEPGQQFGRSTHMREADREQAPEPDRDIDR